MKITVLDAVHCQVEKAFVHVIAPCISYPDVYYRQSRFKKERKDYVKPMVNKKGIFLTGLLPRVKAYCKDKNIPLTIDGCEEKLPYIQPNLKGITLREDQEFLVKQAVEKQRGLLLSPTGSGKTFVIASSIVSCFPTAHVLFLCHTLTLVSQTEEDFHKVGINDVGVFIGSVKEIGKVTIATRQSFINAPEHASKFDVVLCDEAHHCASPDWQKLLQLLPAPVRLGFTATEPKRLKEQLIIEGLIGPVIGDIPIDDGVELGYLARPHVTLIDVPELSSLKSLKSYSDIYKEGIVEYRRRNHIILKTVAERNAEGKSVLILVTNIEHGRILQEMAASRDVDAIFIQGVTEGEIRDQVRKGLHTKDYMCVIATVIWNEGVNIPSLDCVINASGGKSEIGVLQKAGRGLRVTQDKKEIEIIDFLDKGRYLSEHVVHRLSIYSEMGWL